MLHQSARPREGASATEPSHHGSLQSFMSDCRKIGEKPAIAYGILLEKVKAASVVHVPSTQLSVHAFADGFVHLIGPRFVSHLLILIMAAMVAAYSGIGVSRMTQSSSLKPWQFEPFAARNLVQNKTYLDKPVLPFTPKPKRAREGITTYEVASGDTVTSIAEKFEITPESIVSANKLDDADSLQVGDKLSILPVSGILHIVGDGDTVDAIAKKYRVGPEAIITSEYNNLSEPYDLFIDQKLIVPGGKIPEPPPRPMPVARATRPAESAPAESAAPATSAPVRGGGRFAWPTTGLITQGFSGYHPAIDIAPPYGTPIYASEAGVVVSVETLNYGYGLNVVVDHGDGYTTRYSHLSAFKVSRGQQVARGQLIGLNGSTGWSTGPHLDFRIYLNGVAQNPLRYLP